MDRRPWCACALLWVLRHRGLGLNQRYPPLEAPVQIGTYSSTQALREVGTPVAWSTKSSVLFLR